MTVQYGKRILSFFLAIIMILSAVPVQAFAEELDDHQDEGVVVPSEPAEAPGESGESEALVALRAEIAEYIEKLGITPDMPDVMMLYAYGNHASGEEAQASLTKQDEFWEKGKLLSEVEQEILLAEDNTQLALRYREVVENAYDITVAADYTVDSVKLSNSGGDLSQSGGTITATVTGTSGCNAASAAMNIYITNESGEKGTVSFNMKQTDIHSIKVGDANGQNANEDIKGNTSYAKMLAAGEGFSIVITTDKNATPNKLELTDITFTSASATFTVTVEYSTANGSVTSSVAGESADADGTTTMTIPRTNVADGVTLKATAVSGYKFLGWVDMEDNKLLSKAASYTYKPTADAAIQAVFAASEPWFLLNNTYAYEGLEAAVTAASGSGTIALMNDATLPAGNYTIPKGVTLLIPFDAANTLYTTSPACAEGFISTRYRLLTMAEGAHLTVEGGMSLSTKHKIGYGGDVDPGGIPNGTYSQVEMESGSTITVKSGGALYAYGFITGSGSVTIKNGASVYEYFQVYGYRGGTVTLGMKYRVFAVNQYYVQNVEVPMTLESGATEYSITTLYASGNKTSKVAFIAGSGAMFNLTQGSVTKRYDGSTDRLIIDVNGTLELASMNLSAAGGTIKSQNFDLPINSNITVRVNKGSAINIKQDICMLPGAEIIIKEGATCTLGSGNNVYVYDVDEWGPYAGYTSQELLPVKFAPSKNYTRTIDRDATIQVDGTMDASAGSIYTTAGGANIFTNGTGVVLMKPGTKTTTNQATQTGASASYVNIPITTAKLNNGDGTYFQPTANDTYSYVNGKWQVASCIHTYSESITTPAGCETAGVKTFTCSKCGDSYTEEIPATGHTEVIDEAKAPTCSETGLTEGKHCSVCDEVIVAQEVVDALGHTEVIDKAVAATCTTSGLTEGKHCSVCDEVIVAQTVVDALGHTEVIDKAVAPTCTETGKTEGKHCSVCDTVIAAQTVVAAKGHTPGNEATCTTSQICTVCDEVLVAALGHNMNTIAEKEATCTEPGYQSGAECSRCDYTEGGAVIPAKGHTEAVDEAVAATCTATGLTEGKHCSVCNEVIVAQTVVDALGHTEVIDKAVAPTCTETGKTEGKHCSVCNEVIVAQTVVDALGHTEVIDKAVAPTCTETGKTEGKHCSVCGEVLVAQEEVASKGHTEVVDKAVAPTCTEAGKTEGKHCSVCNAVTVAQQVVAANGHKYVADGEHTYHCEVCEITLVDDISGIVGSLKEDKTEEAVSNAVDKIQNIETEQLEVVMKSDSSVVESIQQLETHITSIDVEIVVQEEDVVFAADKVSVVGAKLNEVSDKEENIKFLIGNPEGEKELTIPADQYNTATAVKFSMTMENIVNAKQLDVPVQVKLPVPENMDESQLVVLHFGADGTVAETIDPTITVEAGQKYAAFVVSGFSNFALTEKHSHVYGSVVTAPTCTTEGYTTHSCSCGDSYTDNIVEALGHTAVYSEELPALCEDDGMTEGYYCSVCGVTISGRTPISAVGHYIVEFEGKRPTYSNVGWEAYETCLQCAYTTYVEIPALGAPVISDYETFMTNLALLEEAADLYVQQNPGKDPLELIIKYIRTGVDRYNSGSWGIMAGYEDADFAKFIAKNEDDLNSVIENPEDMWKVTGLKNIENFYLPNGNLVDFGHLFGTMDITYHNNFGVNHADVGGWAGDLADLLMFADYGGVSGTLDEMIAEISANYLLVTPPENISGMDQRDMYGDLDAIYIMKQLQAQGYEKGSLTTLFNAYFTEELSDEDRADFFLKNRLDGVSTRNEVRNAVYNAYTSNKVVATLEGTREFASQNITDLRKACCYAFADYICKLAGDYVENTENLVYDEFSSESVTLAPGITQQIKMANSKLDGKQMVYYLATVDLTRDDVHIYANYNNNDPAAGWAMQRVEDQANAAQKKYGDPESKFYIPNYNVIAAVNGAGYNMETGEPGGLLVMNGVEYSPINGDGFFGILKDGTPVIGSLKEYNTIYKDQVLEAISGFGNIIISNGQITPSAASGRASRTAVGITKTGKVVFVVLDGRQEPFSCGGSFSELAQILKEAGCVEAMNLDGGGSSTYVAKQPGDDALSLINSPSDGYARSVGASWMIVSTAPSSTTFDHALLETETDYLTVGSSVQVTPTAVSAAGNAVGLPEGTTWAVSDEAFGTISEDGVFTARRNGDVNVNLMLGDTVIGTKTLHIVTPDNVYFTKTNIDTVYGATTELPVKVLYQRKEVAFNANDLTFTVSNAKAGSFSGLNFVCSSDENSGIKNVTITAALANNTSITATATVSLYKQGEMSFDFDQATGGDRMLAWYREVLNATKDGMNNYMVIDPDQDMVTNYTLAIDMTQIPVPARLEDLTYMLPGADVEGASAWTFLLQLAERISPMTEITATVQFDSDLDVDISGLTWVNEYFALTKADLDEETNTLTLTLNWKKQTAVIDASTANPLCIVSGLKLTPKADADWDSRNRLQIAHTGTIGYKVYMRAGQLYSFAQKEDNQKVYGLYPYTNPDDSADQGGYFQDTYRTFEDSYALINSVKDGWVNEVGGFAYYVEGERLTGIQAVEGFYYDFGETGINVGQTPYTGLFYDEAAKVYRYSYLGVVTSGWQIINNEWFYFKASTMAAVSGRVKVSGVYYDFEENGKLISGVWVSDFEGMRYYYGPSYYNSRWKEIDGKLYYFRNGYPVTGLSLVASQEITSIYKWYEFDENGVCLGAVSGIIEQDGIYYYVENGLGQEKHLICVDGDYYYATYGGKLALNKTVNTYATNCDLPKGTYTFGPDGKMVGRSAEGEIVEQNGKLYYYENGVGVEKHLVKVGDDYYYSIYKGEVVVNKTVNTYATNCDLPKGTYRFGPDGKMIGSSADGEIVEIDGILYYYKCGKGIEAGLVKVGEDYYYAAYMGKVARDLIVNVKLNSSDIPNGRYEFGSDGKMWFNGIIEKNGVLHYYENGTGVEKGLVKVGNDYYFAVYQGRVAINTVLNAWQTNCDLPKGRYEFGPDGKMLQGIVEKDGVLYYYENGVGVEKGLVAYKGDYYYTAYNGKVAVNTSINVKLNSSDLPNARYEFGADGKMLNGIVEKDGVRYYYRNGQNKEIGLFELDGNYYFAAYQGKLITNMVFNAYMTSCDLPKGRYEFGPDGKMLQGIVEKDGILYYYENGVGVEKGLIELNGDYYYTAYKGKLACSMTVNVELNSSDLPNGVKEFGANGKLLHGIVEKDGFLYFYEYGVGAEKQLFYYEGHYYYSVYKGKLVTNCDFHVVEGHGLLLEKVYTFNEFGQIVK